MHPVPWWHPNRWWTPRSGGAATETAPRLRLEADSSMDLVDQVASLREKYRGRGPGAQWVKRIVRHRQARVLGGGVEVAPTGPEGEAAAAFLRRFLDLRGLNEGKHARLVAGAVLEGRVLVKVEPASLPATEAHGAYCPRLRYVPWYETRYRLSPDPEDPETPARVRMEYTAASGETVRVDEPYAAGWVYVAFNALGLEGYPDLGGVLREIEDIDRLLRDWRTMNAHFAQSIPTLDECRDADEVRRIAEDLKAAGGWARIKTMVTTAKFRLVSGHAGDYRSIQEELAAKVKILCGAANVSPQDIGFPDLLSNRSTAEEMGRVAAAESEAETALWLAFYERIYRLVLEGANASPDGPLHRFDPESVKPTLRDGVARDASRVRDLYLPMRARGDLSRRTLHELTPYIDPAREIERLAAERGETEGPAPVPAPVPVPVPVPDPRPAAGSLAEEAEPPATTHSRAKALPAAEAADE